MTGGGGGGAWEVEAEVGRPKVQPRLLGLAVVVRFCCRALPGGSDDATMMARWYAIRTQARKCAGRGRWAVTARPIHGRHLAALCPMPYPEP